jgi:repressor LexA
MQNLTKPKLTERQQELLDYLRQQQREFGIMPSTRDIQRHFGFSSQTAAMSHLRALQKKGVIQRHPNKARAVVFPEDLNREQIVDVPIYGNIAAGYAEMQDQRGSGTISIDLSSLGGRSARAENLFALRVRGESMIGAHICDGDLVVLENRPPQPHDIVAALIDGETTLKRFLYKDGSAFLHAENPDFPDLIPVTELVVQGVLKTVIRKIS